MIQTVLNNILTVYGAVTIIIFATLLAAVVAIYEGWGDL